MSGRENDIIAVGDPMPTIDHVAPADGPFRLRVRWASGRRVGEDIIDVAPQVFTFKVYKPLRADPDLFAQVSVSDDGSAVVWEADADLEISADALEDLADDTMTSEHFARFLRELDLTFDAAAAQLGISRRLVAYYAKDRQVPRYISLACEALRGRLAQKSSRQQTA